MNIYVRLLQACSNIKSLGKGMLVHGHMIKTGSEADTFLLNNLVRMYVKCASLADAYRVFDKIPQRNLVSWTSMISGYAQHGHGEEALKLYCLMLSSGIEPNQFTFASVLRACAGLEGLEQGKQVHAHTIKTEFDSDVFVGTSVLDMYAKCGNLLDVHKMFDKMPHRNAIAWTSVIAVYAQNGHGEDALKLFSQMQLAGSKPDQFTFASVFRACASIAALEQGKQIQSHFIKTGFQSDLCVGNALVNMYAKCGSMDNARYVFDKMVQRDTVSWSTVIAGYAQHGHGEEALELFCTMQQAGMKPDQFTFASLLSACAGLAALVHGKRLHGHIIKIGFKGRVSVANALVTMYAKCGELEIARHVFDKMPERDVVSWSAMIAGYAQHGHGTEALELFEHMLGEGMKPDHVTFIAILYACSHAGLVSEGRRYFESMIRDHCITPRADHYACIIDLLGRAGRLEEAEDFINNMPLEPDAGVWGSLLSACRIHGNMEIGQRAAKCLFELEPQEAAPYVLLSNIYAAVGRWNDMGKVRKLMKDRGVKKKPGCSWIEVKNKVHAFSVEDRLHPQAVEIYAMLDRLAVQMEAAGYVPSPSFVLNDAE